MPKKKQEKDIQDIPGATTPDEVETTDTSETVVLPDKDNLNPKKVGYFKPIKQSKIADVLEGVRGGSGNAPGGEVAGRSASYSGNDASISGSLAATPSAEGNSRSRSRYGKRTDETIRRINDLASEQVVVEVTTPTPISEGGVQGANKSNRNDFTVRTKTKGSVPASYLFQRSIDEIRKDELVFGSGQVVKDPSAHYEDVPTKTFKLGQDGLYTREDYDIQPRGDFVARALKFTLNSSGVVTDLSWEMDNITSVQTDELIVNKAAPHAKIHANKAELHRRFIDGLAGDESKDNWSPLARAIHEPTRTISFLKDLEQDTGNHAYAASRFGQLSLAYQLNRAGKDGNQNDQPIEEAFMSAIIGERNFDQYTRSIPSLLTSQSDMRRGSPALLISAFDSTSKYRTKGDILNMPNSLKSHLFKGQNFLRNLKANKQLIRYFEKNQAFSTIDGDYDGIRPTYVNDSYLITSPFDFNDLLSFSGRTCYDAEMLVGNNVDPFIYGYHDLRSNYYTPAHHPLLKGIYDWLSRVGSSLVKAGGTGEYTIPIVYSLTKLTTWNYIVMAALADVEKVRLTTMREILYFETKNNKTLFDDLQPLDSYITTTANQFTFSDIGEPIKIGTLSPESKLVWLAPELFWNFDEETRTLVDWRHVVTPWYFNENGFEANGITDVHLDGYSHVMSWFKARAGIIDGNLQDVISMGERRARLSMDMMIYPIVDKTNYADFRVYKYDLSADGLPGLALRQSAVTYGAFLTVPRELGIRVVLPPGYALPLANPVVEGQRRSLLDDFQFDTSFRAKIYTASLENGVNKFEVLDPTSINIDRASLYKQEFYYIHASISAGQQPDGGFLLSMKELFNVNAAAEDTTLLVGKSVFTPFSTFGVGSQAAVNTTEHRIISFHKALWTRMQILPFIISPWDTVAYTRASGEDGNKYDPFDHMYALGFVGFEGSYYEEDHYNRMDKQIQEGYAFVEDVYLSDSPLING